MKGYWTARKGRTTFPFSFRLPASAPSSIAFAGNAAIRYTVKGTAQAWYQESKAVVSTKNIAEVVEAWEDADADVYQELLERSGETKLFLGGSGSVSLQAQADRQLFVAGSRLPVNINIRNASKRDVSGLRMDVIRNLTFPVGMEANSRRGPRITETLHSQHHRGQELDVPAGSQISVTLLVDLPREARTIRKARLFEVSLDLLVALPMGTFAKDLEVRLPVSVAHPASLRLPWPVVEGAQGDSNAEMHWTGAHLNSRSNTPAFDYGHHQQFNPNIPLIPRSQSAMSHHGAHVAFPASEGFPLAPSPAQASNAAEFVALPDVLAPLEVRREGSNAFVSWQPPTANWQASREGHPQVHTRDNIPSRPASAQPELQTLYHEQRNQGLSDQVPHSQGSPQGWSQVQAPSAESGRSPIVRHGEETREGSQNPVIQFEQLDVPGLATIIEVSESAANTLRSVRALGGDRTGAKRSVSPAEIDLFERLVTDDDATVRPPASKMAAARTSVRKPVNEIFANLPAGTALNAASQVVPVAESSIVHDSTMILHPQTVDGESGIAATEQGLKTSETLSPSEPDYQRPKSAQGQGLMALERRLQAPKRAPATMLARDEALQKDGQAKAVQEHSPRVAQQNAQISTKDSSQSKESEHTVRISASHPPATKRPYHSPPFETASTAEPVVIQNPTSPEASEADRELRQLGQQAVARVDDWLRQTHERDSTSSALVTSLKERSKSDTGSEPVVSKSQASEESHNIEPERSVTAVSSAADRSLALGGGTLRQRHDEAVTGGSAAARLTRGHKPSSITSRYEEALRRHSSSANDKVVTNSVTASDSASQSSLQTLALSGGKPQESSLRDSGSTVFSRHVSLSDRKPQETLPTVAAAAQGQPATITSASEASVKPVEVSPSRGTRGGRVASAASLWASIANGTDGKVAQEGSTLKVNSSMRRTTVNIRPHARRSMNGEAPALDFTDKSSVDAAIQAQSTADDTSRGSPTSVVTAAPKAVRPKTKAAIAIPSVFSGRPQNGAGAGLTNEKTTAMSQSNGVKITRRAAPPFLNTTVPKVYMSASSPEKPDFSSAGNMLAQKEDTKALPPSVNGRGTTRVVGKERLNELRSLFAA